MDVTEGWEAKEAPMRSNSPSVDVPITPVSIARGAVRAAEDISSDMWAAASSSQRKLRREGETQV